MKEKWFVYYSEDNYAQHCSIDVGLEEFEDEEEALKFADEKENEKEKYYISVIKGVEIR